jgi:hypothetical protein
VDDATPNEAFLPDNWPDLTPDEQIEQVTGPDAQQAQQDWQAQQDDPPPEAG